MEKQETFFKSLVYCKCTYVILAFIIIWTLKKMFGKRVFAYFMSVMKETSNVKIVALKKEFFEGLSSIQSEDPELRKKNGLRILEVGVGTGVNFQYYPEGTSLVVIDPNPHFKEYYNDNRKDFANIQSEEIIITTGDNMKMVTSNSVDVVVMTLVMCSVDKTVETLKEIHRVLRPGGKFFFFEHIKEFKPEVHYIRAFFQKILTISGIFPFAFDGCHLTKDMSMELQTIGFSEIDSKRTYTPRKGFMWLISPHLIGTATK